MKKWEIVFDIKEFDKSFNNKNNKIVSFRYIIENISANWEIHKIIKSNIFVRLFYIVKSTVSLLLTNIKLSLAKIWR